MTALTVGGMWLLAAFSVPGIAVDDLSVVGLVLMAVNMSFTISVPAFALGALGTHLLLRQRAAGASWPALRRAGALGGAIAGAAGPGMFALLLVPVTPPRDGFYTAWQGLVDVVMISAAPGALTGAMLGVWIAAWLYARRSSSA